MRRHLVKRKYTSTHNLSLHANSTFENPRLRNVIPARHYFTHVLPASMAGVIISGK